MSSSLRASLFAEHLCLDAVVAFVDGEMTLTAFQRAAAHLEQCYQCSAEVAEQSAARQRLRSETCPSIPSDLMAALRSIPRSIPTSAPTKAAPTEAAPTEAAPAKSAPTSAPTEAATPQPTPWPTPKGTLLRTGQALRGRLPLRTKQAPRGK